MALQDQAFRPTAVLPIPENGYRGDHLLVAEMVERGAKVLDVGCGDGTLLAYLTATKKVDGRGMELSMARVRAADLPLEQTDAGWLLRDPSSNGVLLAP